MPHDKFNGFSELEKDRLSAYLIKDRTVLSYSIFLMVGRFISGTMFLNRKMFVELIQMPFH